MTAPICFLDSSAVTKLVIVEAESRTLRERLDGTQLVGSALLVPEVSRAVHRSGSAKSEGVLNEVLEQISLVPIDTPILSRAAGLQPWSLRTLDALHLAAALSLSELLTAFIAYDARLLQAASLAGLPVEQPS